MRTGVRFNKLAGDTHAVPRLSHATFKNIADAEFATDLFHINCAGLVSETRIARDYEKPLDTRKPGDDVLNHAVTKIILLQITTHILEWKHGDRRPAGQWERVRFHRTARLLQLVDPNRTRDV